MSKPRIGVLTSGGDCPGLNAVLRGVVLAADKLGWEVIGFLDGFEGLLPPGNYKSLGRRDTAGIIPPGGTILRDPNRRPFFVWGGGGGRKEAAAGGLAGGGGGGKKRGVGR